MISLVTLKGCGEKEILKQLTNKTNLSILTDDIICQKLTEALSIKKSSLEKLLFKPSLFFGPRKTKSKKIIHHMKILLGEELLNCDKIYNGIGTYFLPQKAFSKFLLGGELQFRIGNLAKEERISIELASKKVKNSDKAISNFVRTYLNENPFSSKLFDAVIDVNKYKKEEIVDNVLQIASQESITTKEIKEIINNFILCSKIQLYYLEKDIDVDCEILGDKVRIFVNQVKYISKKGMLNYFDKIKEMAPNFIDPNKMEITIGKHFDYPQPFGFTLEQPRKVLLVDDEVDFVDTLSERLQNRSFNTMVTYSGEEALETIDKDLPDVMILDLKMPGIDGIEVLRRVKQTHPETEVIILTGHGSEKEKQIALELGAFAYLEKPVDIELLSETIKNAYAKVNEAKRKNI